ncbi:MAG: hypothetical protein GXP55_21450 [Deltaproteobacteria bacterium]|nr:hypothetical protein [Deltaproteobacteria bacterium]
MGITTEEIADECGVRLTIVKNFLRDHGFSSDSRHFRGSGTSLRRKEIRAIRKAHESGELRDSPVEQHERTATVAEDLQVDSLDLRDLPGVTPADGRLAPRGATEFPVYVHTELWDELTDTTTPKPIRKAFTRRAQEVMAYGKATRTKGVCGRNAGFTRVPLGGNSGAHYYLWQLEAGGRAGGAKVDDILGGFPPRARFLRIIRHHDGHRVLPPGNPSDYTKLLPEQTHIADEQAGLIEPLVADQAQIAGDSSRIRLIKGQPGSGKTTSLLASTMTLRGKALYLTWSDHLAEQARRWFAVFAPADLDITVWTFSQFVAAVDASGRFSVSPSSAVATDLLRRRLDPLGKKLGPWRRGGRLMVEELKAELRAHYVGNALPVAFRGRRASCTPHMHEEDYLSSREALGAAAKSAHLAARALSDDDLFALFPEPVAAFERALALTTGALQLDADTFDFEWFMVDEVQDLTLAEQWLLVDVAARCGIQAGVRPGVIVAGDEAQTVRPTAFQWGELKDLLYRRLDARPGEGHEHELLANLRSPGEIASVVHRARRSLYGLLDKSQRPRGRVEESPADATVGRVLQVATAGKDCLRQLLMMFADLAGETALVYPGTTVPEWVAASAEEVGAVVWTADMAKGLEFRAVAVLGVDETLADIRSLASDAEASALSGELARSAIDRLLVALSRSTETLVLLADDWQEAELALVGPLLDDEGPGRHDDERADPAEDESRLGVVAIDELRELLEADAADIRERIESLVEQAEQLFARASYDEAVRLAEKATRLLGRPGRPGSARQELREAARRTFGRCLAARGIEAAVRDDLRNASRCFRLAGMDVAHRALREANAALFDAEGSLESSRALGKLAAELSDLNLHEPTLLALLLPALVRKAEALASASFVPKTRKQQKALLGAMDALASQAPSNTEALRSAHDDVLQNIIHSLAFNQAREQEYAELRGPLGDRKELLRLDARRAESFDRPEEAAQLWVKLGDMDAALRCYRKSGDLEASAAFAKHTGAVDAKVLRWGADLARLIEARPSGSLEPEEQEALRTLLDGTLGVET